MFCKKCGTEFLESSDFCIKCGERFSASKSAKSRPKTVSKKQVAATAAIIIFSLFEWIEVGQWRIEYFNLFSSWSQTNEIRRAASRWLGGAPGEITMVLLLLSILIALLIVSIALQIIALVKQQSEENGLKFSYWGYGISLIVPLVYVVMAIEFNNRASVNPTIFFFLTCIAAIVGIVSSKKTKSAGLVNSAAKHKICVACRKHVPNGMSFCSGCGKSIY